MYDQKKTEIFQAHVARVLGPDMLEADINLGFDVRIRKKIKLGGVDATSVRGMDEDEVKSAVEYLRDRIEGKEVTIRTTRRGDYYYARIYYGPEQSNVVEEMFLQGLLKKFDKINFSKEAQQEARYRDGATE